MEEIITIEEQFYLETLKELYKYRLKKLAFNSLMLTNAFLLAWSVSVFWDNGLLWVVLAFSAFGLIAYLVYFILHTRNVKNLLKEINLNNKNQEYSYGQIHFKIEDKFLKIIGSKESYELALDDTNFENNVNFNKLSNALLLYKGHEEPLIIKRSDLASDSIVGYHLMTLVETADQRRKKMKKLFASIMFALIFVAITMVALGINNIWVLGFVLFLVGMLNKLDVMIEKECNMPIITINRLCVYTTLVFGFAHIMTLI